MNLTSIRPGDTVECNVRGRVFQALVVIVYAHSLDVDPPAGITYHHVTARQVKRVTARGTWHPNQAAIRSGQA